MAGRANTAAPAVSEESLVRSAAGSIHNESGKGYGGDMGPIEPEKGRVLSALNTRVGPGLSSKSRTAATTEDGWGCWRAWTPMGPVKSKIDLEVARTPRFEKANGGGVKTQGSLRDYWEPLC